MAGSLRARWFSLQRQGLPAPAAGNVLAYSLGLTPSAAGWTDVELGRLVLLRWLVERGVIGGEADMGGMLPGGPTAVTVTGELILTRDRSSGTVHRRLRIGESGMFWTAEGCNLDQAGAWEVIRSTEGIEPDRLCRRCFPPAPEIEGELV